MIVQWGGVINCDCTLVDGDTVTLLVSLSMTHVMEKGSYIRTV